MRLIDFVYPSTLGLRVIRERERPEFVVGAPTAVYLPVPRDRESVWGLRFRV